MCQMSPTQEGAFVAYLRLEMSKVVQSRCDVLQLAFIL